MVNICSKKGGSNCSSLPARLGGNWEFERKFEETWGKCRILEKFCEEIWEERIGNEVSLGGSPTIKVTLVQNIANSMVTNIGNQNWFMAIFLLGQQIFQHFHFAYIHCIYFEFCIFSDISQIVQVSITSSVSKQGGESVVDIGRLWSDLADFPAVFFSLCHGTRNENPSKDKLSRPIN